MCYSAEKVSYSISYEVIFPGFTTNMRVFCKESNKIRIEESNFNSVSITIYHLKNNTSLVLNDHEKIAFQRQISEKELLYLKNYTGETGINKLEKIGEDVILGYNCDVFIYEGKYKIKYWLAEEFNLILKFEQGEGKQKMITQAKELRFEEIPNSFFEVPNNYRIVQTIISSEEDLKNEPPITLNVIEELLFENIQSINILISDNKNFRDLTKEEIEIFRLAVENGSELQVIEKNDVNLDLKNRIIFEFKWIGNECSNIRYDKESELIYIEKQDVHRKDEEKHKFDFKWNKKYMFGFYIFKPSQEIKKILY